MPIDKTQLYPTFDKSLRRSQRLADLATRKALDLPLDDEMQIITNHTRTGLGRGAALLLSLAMLATGGGAALGTFGLLEGFGNRRPEARPETARGDEAPLPPAQEFKVTFWTEDGENLEVQESE